jgi:hypothetical protein
MCDALLTLSAIVLVCNRLGNNGAFSIECVLEVASDPPFPNYFVRDHQTGLAATITNQEEVDIQSKKDE